eukprot:g2791.t1
MAALADLKATAELYIKWDPNPATRGAIQNMLDEGRTDDLSSVLSKRLKFGTAGLRAKMGPGYNRMNDLVVLQTTQGLALYLEKQFGAAAAHEKGVAIGYDHRANDSLSSKKFGAIASAVLLSRGFKVYLVEKDGFAATPIVAFCTLEKSCAAGIMVTASHNPKEDDGYKVYWDNGAQIVPPHDSGIASCILEALEPWEAYGTSFPTDDSIRNHPNCVDPTDEISPKYFKKASDTLCFYPQLHEKWGDELKVVYTAMHGVGNMWCLRSFEAFQLSPYYPVKRQCDPDPTFPTVAFPNPEEGEGALQLAFEEAERVGASIVLANDPDADRLAVAERGAAGGGWKVFNGNEIGILLGHWITVSSKMLKAMAVKEGFQFEDTMTGFKWMGSRTAELHKEGVKVLFAYEQAIGFCLGTVVRDKDGVVASAVFAEMARYLWHEEQKTVAQQLETLCQRYGYFEQYDGYLYWDENSTVDAIFDRLRNNGNYWLRAGPYKINNVRDLTDEGYDSSTPSGKPTLPTSKDNMLTYYFANGCIATFRLSGTEPKLKYYFELSDSNPTDARKRVKEMGEFLIQEMLQPEKNKLITP